MTSDTITDVADLARRAKLSEAALALVAGKTSPRQLLDALIAGGHVDDAVRALCCLLDPRKCAYWAVAGLRAVSALEKAPAPQLAAHQAAEAWVKAPSEDTRRTAEAAAHAAEFNNAAAWCAMTAVWSGGSLAPAGVPEVPAPPHLYVQAGTGAILLAANSGDASKALDRAKTLLALGVEILDGKKPLPA